MLPIFLKNYGTEFHEIFRDDLSSSKDQSIKFWKQSGLRSRSRSQKGQNYWNELHEIFRNDLSSSKDQLIRFWEQSGQRSKVKVQVTIRSKTYFCHNTLSFRPIHMKPTPKCSLFNSLSSDMVTNVVLVKVCALPSAHSSLFLLLFSYLLYNFLFPTGAFGFFMSSFPSWGLQ